MVWATVALGHELTYLLANGGSYDTAMAQAGHERYWLAYLLIVGLLSGALVVVVVAQLVRLRRLAGKAKPGARNAGGSAGQFVRLIGRLWLRTAAAAALVYLIQENLELLSAGSALPGLAVAAGDQVIALPVLGLVALAAAAIAALVSWRRGALLRRIQDANDRPPGRTPYSARPPAVFRVVSFAVVAGNGVRAPPGRVIHAT